MPQHVTCDNISNLNHNAEGNNSLEIWAKSLAGRNTVEVVSSLDECPLWFINWARYAINIHCGADVTEQLELIDHKKVIKFGKRRRRIAIIHSFIKRNVLLQHRKFGKYKMLLTFSKY